MNLPRLSVSVHGQVGTDKRVDSELRAFTVAGVRIHAVSIDETVARICHLIQQRVKSYVVLTGAHGVVEMQQDPELLRINNNATLTTPDGMSVVWVAQALGLHNAEKVCAPDLMPPLFAATAELGFKNYLYGGVEGVADQLAAVVRERFPSIKIVGTECPPFHSLTAEEALATAKGINAAAPDIVWCGLGCPKQDRWMAQFRPLLEAPVLIGVGAGFDFLTGRVKRAPAWMRRSGLEWFYRVLADPRRMAPRFSRVVPTFLWLCVRSLWRKDIHVLRSDRASPPEAKE